jgi:hypothetical protein
MESRKEREGIEREQETRGVMKAVGLGLFVLPDALTRALQRLHRIHGQSKASRYGTNACKSVGSQFDGQTSICELP